MKHSILIVDDAYEDASSVGDYITNLIEVTVEFAQDRDEAWIKLRENQYDAMVLDLDLNGPSEGELLLRRMGGQLRPPVGTVIVSTIGDQPGARNLKGRFPFVAEVVPKKHLRELPDVMTAALQQAIGLTAKGRLSEQRDPEPVSAPPRESDAEPKEHTSRLRIVVIGAIIAALATIIAALIGALPDLLGGGPP